MVARTYLTAAWCCDDDNMTEEESSYRRHAIEHYETALREGTLPISEVAPVTYLIGELYRRVGETEEAARWFDRVPDAAAPLPAPQWLIDLAEAQKTNPRDVL